MSARNKEAGGGQVDEKALLVELAPRIVELLRGADLESVSAKAIRKQLQNERGESLEPIKPALNQLIVRLYEELLDAEAPAQAKFDTAGSGAQEAAPAIVRATTPPTIYAADAPPALQASSESRKRRKIKSSERVQPDDDARAAIDASHDGQDSANLSQSEQAEFDELVANSEKRVASGFNAELRLSPALAAAVNVDTLSRPQIAKRLWEYIKANDLQDPADRRVIRCDNVLRAIFKKDTVDMFTMNKLIKRHVRAAGDDRGFDSDASSDESIASNEASGPRPSRATPRRAKKQRRKRSPNPNSPFKRPLGLSPSLAEFLGVDTLDRPGIVKRLWDHIKAHNLQDPGDKRYILCDAGLKRVFRTDRLHMFTMNKVLSELVHPLGEASVVDGDVKAEASVAEGDVKAESMAPEGEKSVAPEGNGEDRGDAVEG